MREIEAQAPCRADLAGGTLDIWPLGLLHPGAVTVNVAIRTGVRLRLDGQAPTGEVWHAVGEGEWQRLNSSATGADLTAAVCFHLRPDGGLRVRVLEQAPMGSGLGGSSTYGVALCRAVLEAGGRRMEPVAVVNLVRDLEARILSTPTGTQDHWAAVHGGVLSLHFEPGGEVLETLAVDPGWLGERLTVFFTGMTHSSGMVNWQVVRRRLEGEVSCSAALEAIAGAARACRVALLEQDEAGVAGAIRQEWAARKRLAPEVCPPQLDELERVARTAGAAAFKACGAGGGGSVALWHPAGVRDRIVAALGTAAVQGGSMPAGIATSGCTVRRVDEV